jgi:predicted HTH domain antitoxin
VPSRLISTKVSPPLRHETNQPVQLAASEMIVLELYRRGAISSGKAGELLRMPRLDFIRHASQLGIPNIDMTSEEWENEGGHTLCRSREPHRG